MLVIISLILSSLSLIMCVLLAFNAGARLAEIQKSTKDLDWQAVADLTGEVGSVKRSMLKLNQRLNGMESGSKVEQELLAALAQGQVQQTNGVIQQNVKGG